MRRWLGILGVIACYFTIASLASPATSGSPMRDFGAYYAAGVSWDAHVDPYGTGVWATEQTLPQVDPRKEELLPFINPPVLLPALGLLARLPFRLAGMIWSALLSFALLALVFASLALAQRPLSWSRMLIAIAVAIVFTPIFSGMMLGQIAILGASAVAVAAWGYMRSSAVAPVATWIAALEPPLLLPLAVWFRNGRSALVLLASGAVYLLLWIGLSAAGLAPTISTYLTLLREHGNAERFALIQYTPAAIAYGLGASAHLASAISIGIAILALCAWIAFGWRERDPVISFTMGCVLTPFIIPFFHEHDFTLVFPAIVVALLRNSAALGWIVAATVLIGVNWVWLVQRPDEAALNGFLAFALACLTYILAWRKLKKARHILPVAGALAVFVVVAVIAQHHQAAVWPDAMKPFTVAADASAAAIWHAEQSATGMFAHNAFWALARCPPFLGCIALLICLRRSRSDETTRENV